MTLDNPERQHKGFYGFLAISGCETHFKSELRRNQLASFSRKQLQIGRGMLPTTASISDELFSCINIDDFEKTLNFQNILYAATFKIGGFIDFCYLRL